MSEMDIVYLFYFLIVYFAYRTSRYLALLFLFIALILPVFKNINILLWVYVVISSFSIFGFLERFKKDNKKDRIYGELVSEKERLSRQLLEIKKETDDLLIYDKKNLALYSILNILSRTIDFSGLKSIERYLNEVIGAKTGVYLKTEDGFVHIFGSQMKRDDYNEQTIEDGKTIIPLKDNEVYAYVVVESVDKIVIEEAIDVGIEISPFIKKVYLFNKIDSLSLKDGLTGVYRRGIFNEKLKEEVIRARYFKYLLGIMMIDIDHFKHINDTYGHQAGDEILKEVARIINDSVYETDFVARYGGEEFVIIMPRAERGGSFRKADFIREKIEKERFKAGLVEIKVTISIGLAYYPDDATTPEELIEKADKALYYSKENGRNRVTDWQEIGG